MTQSAIRSLLSNSEWGCLRTEPGSLIEPSERKFSRGIVSGNRPFVAAGLTVFQGIAKSALNLSPKLFETEFSARSFQLA
jgi:hypothetical protein